MPSGGPNHSQLRTTAISPVGQHAHLSRYLPFLSDANFKPLSAGHPGSDSTQAQQMLSLFTLQAPSSVRCLPTQSRQPEWPFAQLTLSSHGQYPCTFLCHHPAQRSPLLSLDPCGHSMVQCPFGGGLPSPIASHIDSVLL